MREQAWRCNDGRRLLISQLDDSHLANCIAMIKRGADARGRRVTAKTSALLPALELEQNIRKWGLRK